MAKKRQQDFGKVQLKPGRAISKRTNITSTNFKVKKVIMPKEKVIKTKSELTCMDYIRQIKLPGNENDKSKLFNELSKLISRRSGSLNGYILPVFDTAFFHITDAIDNVRNGALKVILSVLEFTDDLQLHYFADMVCKNISAIMKHPNPKIAPVSLKLLYNMLKHHPALICHSTNILFDLLPTERRHYTRKITNEKENFQYSENDEINALAHISAFLENILLLKNKNDLEKNEENIVDMDEKATKSVVLYAGGGLEPVDIEEAFAAQVNPQVDPFVEVENLTSCIDSLLKYIPNYFCQIIARESNAVDNAFRGEPISDLSILIELLCNVAELAETLGYSKAAEEIAAFLKEKVFSSHRKRFPFEFHSVMYDKSLQMHERRGGKVQRWIDIQSPLHVYQRQFESKSLLQLNVCLCYLQMKFLSSDDSYDDDGKLIKRYLEKIFSAQKVFSSEVKYQCVPYFIKIIQLFEYKTDVPEVIFLLLEHLILLLKNRTLQPNKKILMKFLLDMSLLPGYKFWIETEPMKMWYEYLIGHLKDFAKLDKSDMIMLCNMMCKIAKLRHSSFIQLLDFNVLKPLLTKRHGGYKQTATLLLHNMDIDKELLKNVYDVIKPDAFPKKLAINLIHMLSVRFNQYPANERPYVDYIEFLLNIAIDVSNFSKSRMIDVEANDYTKAVQLIQHRHPFCIVPSIQWEEHHKLFEVCLKYLRNLPMAPVSVMFMRIVNELLHSSTLIPMHCALAMLKLDMPELNEKHHRLLMRNLNFSCLLTTSILTQTSMNDNDEWYKWNVSELMNSMSLTTNSVIRILELLEQGNFGRDRPDALVVYHICRVLKVFVERNILDYECADVLELILQAITGLVEEQCIDKSIKQQPLFLQMYNFFINHFCE